MRLLPLVFGLAILTLPLAGQRATIDEAIARGELAEVQRQLKAHPERASQGSHPRLMPLHQAILRKQSDIALALIAAGADVNAVDSSQRTPVHLAVERNLPKLIPVMVEAGAELNALDSVGWTPLHWAAAKDRLELAQALINAGADVHARTTRGGTILHEAASSGGEAMVRLCLAQGVDTTVVASDGGTALEVAREFGNDAAIRWLTPLVWQPSFNDAPVPREISEAIDAALPRAAIAPVQEPRRILIFSATAGFRHKSIPTGKAALSRMGDSTGAYQAVVSDEPAYFEIDALRAFDAVVLLNTTQDFFMPPKSERDRFTQTEWIRLQERHERLVDHLITYVGEGGGLVGIHSATDSCYGHEAYGETMGAYFDGHPWNARTRVTIVVEDPAHATIQPVFGEQGAFEIVEEIYQFKPEPYSRERLRILLALDPERSDPPAGELKRSDNDYPVAWVQSVGDGRVFYTSLGHNHHIFTNPLVLKHYLAGIQFACGDLKADTTPIARNEAPADKEVCPGVE
jgi:type 1 glutamine amidotransferase